MKGGIEDGGEGKGERGEERDGEEYGMDPVRW